MRDDIQAELEALEAALDILVQAHIRAITPPDRMADRFESLDACSEATRAISAMLNLKSKLNAPGGRRVISQDEIGAERGIEFANLQTRQEPDHPMR